MKRKWATFTYIGKETSYITKIFKHTDIRIGYRTNNLQHHLTKYPHIQDKFTQSGVYKLTCPDCGKACIGQTDWDLKTRFNEHKRSFLYNIQASKYAQHLIEHQHSFGNIHSIIILQPTYLWYALPSSSSLKRPAVSRSSILTLYN